MPRTILLAEDDADTRLALSLRLRGAGYKVVVAADGLGATSAAQREHPDLVLLDLGLPGGDGFTVLERLARLGAMGRLPVIVLTARSSEADHRRAMDLGAVMVMVKPPDNDALLAAIAKHLPAEAPPPPQRAARGRVLLIEDDGDTRLGMTIRLEASGYDVSVAGDAATAMTRALHDRPDVVLLDLGLPAGDGFLVLQRLKLNPQTATIPVIVVSARDPATNAPRALAAGACAYVQKPPDNAQLLADIERAIHGGP